jgi:uncharacterized protein with PQ loop repeat
MLLKEIIDYIATFFTISMKIPQVYHTIKSQSTKDLSMYFLLASIVGHISWIVYGVVDSYNIPIIITDSVCLFLTLLLIIAKKNMIEK